MKGSHARYTAILTLALLPILPVFAQHAGQGSDYPNHIYNTAPAVASKGTVLVLTVNDDKKHALDRQAIVQITNTTDNRSRAIPTEAVDGKTSATLTSIDPGVYDVAVSAVGFLTSHQQFVSTGLTTTQQMQVMLKRDPSAVDLDAIKTREISPKVRKDLLQGWAALKSGKLDDAVKKLEAASKLDPNNGDVAFLLGYVSFEKHDLERAHEYLNTATKFSPHNVQALTLQGRVESMRGNFDGARGPLQQAVTIDPENWMAHYLLANVYLKGKEYNKARDEAELAIAKGKGAANAAELPLGQALAQLDQNQEALVALQSFLDSSPTDPAAPQVREIISKVEKRKTGSSTQTVSSMTVPEPVFAKTEPEAPSKGWEPLAVDSVKPTVAPGVTCPQGKVIWSAGENVKMLVDDLAKFDATEEVYHEEFDQNGIPKKEVTLKFDYVVSIAEPTVGRFIVDEYRAGRSGTEEFPDQIATKGLPTLAFIFHPDMRDNFDMECEGLGTWQGKSAWLVHFEQKEDKPHRIEDYVVNGQVYPVSMKGRAWIDADTYQIVRLESDLSRPIPEIQLFKQHQTVEYAPVKFPKSKTELWLPKTGELTFDFRRHHYYRRHSFDRFMLFAVDSQEKRKEPTAKSDGPGSHFMRWLHHNKVKS
jgi:tetratricopeptide (TPR) repeat protein